MQRGKIESVVDKRTRLLAALVEELKLPLVQIVHKSQLARLTGDIEELKEVEVTAQASLKLLDSYLLTTQSLLSQQQLDLQPVSVDATMHDAVHYLSDIARLYDCELSVKTSRRLGLVMAHPDGLRAALIALTYSLITSSQSKNKIILDAHSKEGGIEAGVFNQQIPLKQSALQQAKKLYGRAKQPFASVSHSSGAGIYIAEYLFEAMAGSNLLAKQKNQNFGLCSVMVRSHQLSLL